jgi:NAD(P)-dependent dehydrogenase (short-subunit alcohol dehydrogenase family)
MSQLTFTKDDIPDMTGKRVVITGANSGIGRSAAAMLAERGASVTLAVRNLDKGNEAASTMTGDVEVRKLDLADLASVRAFADDWGSNTIDVLINNAGIMVPPFSRTADGFEMQFGTNHLGHFALTGLLLPNVTGRVVTVSSSAHRVGSIDFADLNWDEKKYKAWRAYGQSKLANLLFTYELQHRLGLAHSSVLSMSAHPGWARTNLQSHSENAINDLVMDKIGNRYFAQGPDGGALPTLYAALGNLPGNSFAGPSQAFGMRGPAQLVARSKAARDKKSAKWLWYVSEELTGVKFGL